MYDIAKDAINSNRNNAYLFILWAAFKHIDKGGKISKYIKDELANLELEKFDFDQRKKKASRIIEKIGKREKSVLTTKKDLRINSVQIKNFKGFGQISDEDRGVLFEFNKYKNILFAPNGGGKTSFCEALEYALTNNIKECVRRNIPLKRYISRDNKNPKIEIKFNKRDICTDNFTREDHAFFEQCFIERNRLNEFAFLGSKDTKTNERDIMAIILGLNELEELINSFVQPKQFNLDEYKKFQINNRISELEAKKINLQKQIELFNDKIKKLFNQYDIQSIDQISELIISKERELEILNKEINSYSEGLKEQNFEELVSKLKEKISHFEMLQKQIEKDIVSLNLEEFYNALLKIESGDFCPACNTPLSQTVNDPFLKARKELENLKSIREAKLKMNSLMSEIDKFFIYLITELDNYNNNIKINSDLRTDSLDNLIHNFYIQSKQRTDDKLNVCKEFIELYSSNHDQFLKYKEKLDHLLTKAIEEKALVEQKKEKLDKISNEIDDLKRVKTLYESYVDNIDELNNEMINNEKEHEMLKIQKMKEDEFNQFVDQVQIQYVTFLNDLKEYKRRLEQQKLDSIEKEVVYYYQQINKFDQDFEFVTDIEFKENGDKYSIVLTTKQKKEVNASSFLSEGHMRALGFSIMLAIAKKYELPFLIFDDVVNAIDSDHRANIIDLMYNDDYLNKTQLIITTHDRLFWERFSNTYAQFKNVKGDGTELVSIILNNTNKGIVGIQYNVSFQDKIEKALQNYDIRQALIYCRIWFETLAVQFCVERGEEIKGKFRRDQKSNLLQPSLESVYGVLERSFPNSKNLEVIRKDLINWQGQNQEHHTFDENSFNFVHSKNSNEVQIIYDAVRRFSYELNKELSIERLEKELSELEERKLNKQTLLSNSNFINKAPASLVEKYKFELELIENKIEQIRIDLFELNNQEAQTGVEMT